MNTIKETLESFAGERTESLDFNFLMKVVGKIEKYKVGVDNHFNVAINTNNYVKIYLSKSVDSVTEIIMEKQGDTLLETLIIACNHFIEWVNDFRGAESDTQLLLDILVDEFDEDEVEYNPTEMKPVELDKTIRDKEWFNLMFADFIMAAAEIRKENHDAKLLDKEFNQEWDIVVEKIYDLAIFFSNFLEVYDVDYSGHMYEVIKIFLEKKNERNNLSVILKNKEE